MSAPIRIGTAGWTIPAACAPQFEGEGSHLERYSRQFAAAEINSSFHRPHRPETYQRWAAAVPDNFLFSVKCPRTMTHDLRLRDCGEAIERFAAEVTGLGGKLGLVLVQLPPSLAFEASVAAAFLAELRGSVAVPLVCEPRHASWFDKEADIVLEERRVARVAADPFKFPGADAPGGWRGLAYFRLHGSPRIYRSAYGEERCREIAAQLRSFASEGEPAWCIFDNTASGAATADALRTQAAIVDT